MNNDLISRSALQAVFANECVGLCDCCKHIKDNPVGCALIDNAPAVDAEHVRHGEWLNRLNGMFQMGTCSVCGSVSRDTGRFCPNCGARMDGGGGK